MKRIINKQLNNQRAMEYITYMMVSSYFRSAKCSSKVIERRLLLHYKELSDKLQVEREKKCINFVERFLMKKLPESIWCEDVLVTMEPDAKTGKMIVSFKGNGWTLALSYNGESDTHFEYSFKQKTDPSNKDTVMKHAA